VLFCDARPALSRQVKRLRQCFNDSCDARSSVTAITEAVVAVFKTSCFTTAAVFLQQNAGSISKSHKIRRAVHPRKSNCAEFIRANHHLFQDGSESLTTFLRLSAFVLSFSWVFQRYLLHRSYIVSLLAQSQSAITKSHRASFSLSSVCRCFFVIFNFNTIQICLPE
jgi:hypothetical protein